MQESFLALPWLAPAPQDFSIRCRALGGQEESPGLAFQTLAQHRLNATQSAALAKAMRKAREADRDLGPLSPLRLGVLAGATFDFVIDCIPAAAARHGVAVEIVSAPYGQVMQQALDPASAINRAKLDAVLVAVDHRWLGLDRATFTDPDVRIAEALSRLKSIVAGLSAPAILETVPTPPETLFGSFDRRYAGSPRAMIAALNRAITALAEETGSLLLDTAALAERIGADLWFDPVHWVSYKLPFSAECFPAYAEVLGRLLGAIRGKARKCLVLDLDNTLWGGVIGDDGIEGIVLGQGSAQGESFLAVQRMALELRERGIVLAVSSKNTHEVALGAVRDHPEMLLRESHFAAFQANWLDKPANLEAIAKTLNLGLEALVVLDDNPAERAQIRAALPMVAVPELPRDPGRFAWVLASAGYFEAIAYSAEDAARAASYASDARRAEVKASARDVGDYLGSLEMVLRSAPFDAKNRPRIAQLINKTNQFNLTTRRYSEAEVAAMEMDATLFTLQVRLEDRFGDLGMIGVVICRQAGDVWEIDTWLMSCRVLGRRVEEAMLDAVMEAAHAKGVRALVGRYIATAKNAMVADHYQKLGFAETDEGRFVRDVAAYARPQLPFR